MKDEIPSHNIHERPNIYNLELKCLHVNVKFIILLYYDRKGMVYIIITNTTRPPPALKIHLYSKIPKINLPYPIPANTIINLTPTPRTFPMKKN